MRRRSLALFGAVALAWGCGGGSEAAPVVEQTTGLPAHLWKDVTAETIGETSDWSNKVELADLNGDGLVDLLFANEELRRHLGRSARERMEQSYSWTRVAEAVAALYEELIAEHARPNEATAS